MFAGVLIALSPAKTIRTVSKSRARRPGAKQGFMDRLNDRWDRRQDEQR
jgi:hypothetical protein